MFLSTFLCMFHSTSKHTLQRVLPSFYKVKQRVIVNEMFFKYFLSIFLITSPIPSMFCFPPLVLFAPVTIPFFISLIFF